MISSFRSPTFSASAFAFAASVSASSSSLEISTPSIAIHFETLLRLSMVSSAKFSLRFVS